MMSPVAAAAGQIAVDSLESLCRHTAPTAMRVVRHQHLAVAWRADCPWVDVDDDGVRLVVLDGRLHNGPVEEPAHWLARRYSEQSFRLAEGLVGDFIIIILDRPSQTLLIARDPVGVRPWYQAATADQYVGAYDLATVSSLSWVDTSLNETMAIEHLAVVAQSRGPTLYRGIETLRPGETWIRSRGGSRRLTHHRWSLAPDLQTTWAEAAERCRVLLDDAVKSRLSGNASPTSEVSGGLDSSAVAGTAALLGYPNLAIARLVFDSPRADERAYSDAVIEHWKLPDISTAPWIPTEEEAWELTRRLRQPVPDPNFTMFLSLRRELAKSGRAELLTGVGGDDAFIPSSIGSRVVSSVLLRQTSVIGRLTYWAARHPRQAWRELIRPTLHHLAWWKGGRPPYWVRKDAAVAAGLPEIMRERPRKVSGVPAIDERLSNLTLGYAASFLEDRAVLNDLVGRRESHPFLDPRFVTGTYGFDPWWPVRDGHTRALQIAAFRDRLPPLVAGRRTKVEFSEVFWPQLLSAPMLHQVSSGPLYTNGWLDAAGFRKLVQNAREGKANAAIPLSRCVSLHRWLMQR